MINPYTILAAVLLIVGVAVGADRFGHSRGVDQQKAEDQVEFDRIDAERTKQKAEANSLYQGAQASIIALQGARDKLKTKLETDRVANRKATDDLRAEYSSARLRFPSQGAGDRPNGLGANGSAGNAAGNAAAAECVVPEAIAGRLRGLAYDADTLRDDFKLLFEWAHGVQ